MSYTFLPHPITIAWHAFKTSAANFCPIFLSGKFPRCTLMILRSNEVPYPAPLGVLFFTWGSITTPSSSHHAAVAGDCLSIIVTSSANVREVQQTEANYRSCRATFAKDALFKMHPQSSVLKQLLFFGNCREGLKKAMTTQHHTQQDIILAHGAALCATQHDSPWLNTTVHCADCRKFHYARWNHYVRKSLLIFGHTVEILQP